MSLERTFTWADDPSLACMMEGMADLQEEIAALRQVLCCKEARRGR